MKHIFDGTSDANRWYTVGLLGVSTVLVGNESADVPLVVGMFIFHLTSYMKTIKKKAATPAEDADYKVQTVFSHSDLLFGCSVT